MSCVTTQAQMLALAAGGPQVGRNFQVIYEADNAHGAKVQTAGASMADNDAAVGSSWA
jgi:hypothetical protein